MAVQAAEQMMTSPGRPTEQLFLRRLASALAAQGPLVTLVVDDLRRGRDPGVGDLTRSVRGRGTA